MKYLKFRDDNIRTSPLIHWAITSVSLGYMLTLTVEERDNALYAGVFSKFTGSD